MKLSILGILLLPSIIIMSCSSPTQKNGKVKSYSVDTSLLKPADVAKADIAFFDTLCTKLLTFPRGFNIPASQIPIKGFTIRAEDLLAALEVSDGIPKYNNIRVYLGYSETQNMFKLYILPVDRGDITDSIPGRDVLLDRNGLPAPIIPRQPLADRYVLDLNAPCPNLCDEESLLLGPTTQK